MSYGWRIVRTHISRYVTCTRLREESAAYCTQQELVQLHTRSMIHDRNSYEQLNYPLVSLHTDHQTTARTIAASTLCQAQDYRRSSQITLQIDSSGMLAWSWRQRAEIMQGLVIDNFVSVTHSTREFSSSLIYACLVSRLNRMRRRENY